MTIPVFAAAQYAASSSRQFGNNVVNLSPLRKPAARIALANRFTQASNALNDSRSAPTTTAR